MFTGIVQDIGKVVNISHSTVHISTKLTGLNIGDSIAVDGVCLTITKLTENLPYTTFIVEVSEETLKRTTLGLIKPKTFVNLESAMKGSDLFGGHFVTGHIDTVIKNLKITKLQNSKLFVMELSKNFSKYIVEKGSVTIDGVSLTVVNKTTDSFCVSLIPYTLNNTTLGLKKVGDKFNLEVDILAKYIESITESKNTKLPRSSQITPDFLKNHGF